MVAEARATRSEAGQLNNSLAFGSAIDHKEFDDFDDAEDIDK